MRISMERKVNTIHIRTKQWGGLFCLPLETEVNQISEMSVVIDWPNKLNYNSIPASSQL